MNKISFIPCY